MPLLRLSDARAGSTVPPLRLIQIWSPFQNPGPFYHPWTSSTDSTPAPDGSTSFYLGFPNSILAPLAPFQSDILVFRGLTYANNMGPQLMSHSSNSTVFTGANSPGSTNNSSGQPAVSGSTLDSYLYGRMAPPSAVSPPVAGFFTYIFGDHCYDDDIAYNSGNPTQMIGNPLNFYNQLFGNFTPPSQGMPVVNPAVTRRQQTLGLVQKYLKQYQAGLPSSAASYAVLQSHLSAAQGLAAQLGGAGSPVSVGCTPPSASSVTNDTGPDDGAFIAGNTPLDIASFIQVTAMALACDITRFATIKMSDSDDPSQIIINYMPGLTNYDQGGNWHADITHAATGDATNTADQQLALFKTYFMSQVANLLSALKSVADPYSPSQTLYDNTVVLVGSEGTIQSSGTDPHGNGTNDQALLLAGGCGGYFKRGRVLYAGGSTAPTVNHNALLTNIVNAFERNQQQFNPAYAPMMLTQYGDFPFSVSPSGWLT
jgi:hypothetical protein